MPQTTYGTEPTMLLGAIHEPIAATSRDTYTLTGDQSVMLGSVVAFGTAQDQAKPPEGSTAPQIIGVCARDTPADIMTDTNAITAGQPLCVVRQGVVTVNAETAVAQGAQAAVRNTVAAGKNLGDFAASGTAGCIDLPGCYFRSTSSAAGLAVVAINLP